MNERQLNTRYIKLFGIVWCLAFIYAFSHHFANQTHFVRFPSMFNSYLELYFHNYIGEFSSSAAEHAINAGKAFEFLLYIDLFIHYVTGLDQRIILLIPIGSFLIPLSYLFLSKSFFRNYESVSILTAIFSVIYCVSFKYFRASYVDTFAIIAFILLISCLKKIQDNKCVSQYSTIAILMLVFLVGLWHTMAFIGTIFTISIFCIACVFNLLNNVYGLNSKINLVVRWNLVIVSLVMIVFFKINLLTPYLKEFISDGFLGNNFLEPFIRNLQGKPTLSVSSTLYQFNYIDTYLGNIYFKSNLCIHIIASLMIIFSIFFFLKALISKKEIKTSYYLAFLFVVTAIISQIIFSVLYSKTATGFFYVTYLFPLVGAYLLNIFNKNKIATTCLTCLILFGCILLYTSHTTYENYTTPITKYEDTNSSFLWISEHMSMNCDVYIDFNLMYKYLAQEIEKNIPMISYQDISGYNYQFIVGDSKPPENLFNSYVVVDVATMSANRPINIYEGRGLLYQKLNSINSNNHLNKIYLDGCIGLYRFK